MTIEFLSASVQRHDIATRMPFKYGIATMTNVPHVFITVTVRIDNSKCTGYSADHLPPKWFTKDPETPVEREIADMESAINQAIAAAEDIVAPNPFNFWKDLYDRLMNPPNFPPLLQHFGISLIERAMLDAVCRSYRQPLWKLIREDLLGIDLGSLSPELSSIRLRSFLPPKPLNSVTLRHTVGMADPLHEADIPDDERLNDGLPQSLQASILQYGLREFKLKLCGETESDLNRLRDIASVITKFAPDDFRFSLDGNEQFTTPGQLCSFGDQVYQDKELSTFFGHLIFIEQPINRKVALEVGAPDVSNAWPCPVPIIIDESDGALEDFPRALDLGYAGVSHKNCKGVFKGLRNRALIAHHQAQHPDRAFLMTGEDLANIGPVALLQDLAVQALLGNASVERNGHHYFKGLSMFPEKISRNILAHHPDLYHSGTDGHAYLTLRDGTISLDTVNACPFGIA